MNDFYQHLFRNIIKSIFQSQRCSNISNGHFWLNFIFHKRAYCVKDLLTISIIEDRCQVFITDMFDQINKNPIDVESSCFEIVTVGACPPVAGL